jgi:hypothetical protein
VQFTSASSDALKLAARNELHQLLDRATQARPGTPVTVSA